MDVDEILRLMRKKASARNVRGMARFGMSAKGRLGVSVPELRRISRLAGKDHRLALALWKTEIAEARIVASMVAEPEKVTARQMEAWVVGIDSWDICFCNASGGPPLVHGPRIGACSNARNDSRLNLSFVW